MKKHGLRAIGERNAKKAGALYAEVDRNPLFKGTAAVEDRSIMNGCFVLNDGVDESLNQTFLDMCKETNISGLKGHRSVGGFRASMYNALPQESVDALVEHDPTLATVTVTVTVPVLV